MRHAKTSAAQRLSPVSRLGCTNLAPVGRMYKFVSNSTVKNAARTLGTVGCHRCHQPSNFDRVTRTRTCPNSPWSATGACSRLRSPITAPRYNTCLPVSKGRARMLLGGSCDADERGAEEVFFPACDVVISESGGQS